MVLLDKWFKKKKKDQLEAVENQEPDFRAEKNIGQKRTADAEKNAAKKEKAKKKPDLETPPAKKTVKLGRAYNILVRPIVSEKAAMVEKDGVISFVVSKGSNKIEIKKAIKELYGILPVKVRIMNIEGRKVRFGRQTGKRGDWKKAIVTLPKGQMVNIHEGV
ncbi:MAG: 50S ribosomal protein L23 [Patescibacteria group bacterium]